MFLKIIIWFDFLNDFLHILYLDDSVIILKKNVWLLADYTWLYTKQLSSNGYNNGPAGLLEIELARTDLTIVQASVLDLADIVTIKGYLWYCKKI